MLVVVLQQKVLILFSALLHLLAGEVQQALVRLDNLGVLVVVAGQAMLLAVLGMRVDLHHPREITAVFRPQGLRQVVVVDQVQ